MNVIIDKTKIIKKWKILLKTFKQEDLENWFDIYMEPYCPIMEEKIRKQLIYERKRKLRKNKLKRILKDKFF
jgi:hypothetical protein